MAHPLPMASPTTPQKREDPINNIARSLNAKWNLELPIKERHYSPSKLSYPAKKEEQAFGLIKFLHYKYPTALKKATAAFEDEALRLEANWKGQSASVQRSTISGISSYFSQRKDAVIKGKKSIDSSTLLDELLQSLSAAKTSCLEEGDYAEESAVPTPPKKTVDDPEHSSLYDCSIDDATLAALDGEDKEATPFEEDLEDVFTTPLSSPKFSPNSSPSSVGRSINDNFERPETFMGQKRPLPDPTRRVTAPKISRGGESHISPCQSISEAQDESPLARSFASTASSSFISSLESSQKVVDTAATSFTSNASNSTQANQQLAREAADAMLATAPTISFNSHPFFQVPEPLPDLLLRESPFLPARLPMYCNGSFRQSYEIGRAALHCKIHPRDIPQDLSSPIMDYSTIWSSLSKLGTLPERSKPKAWMKAERTWSGVSLSGELMFNWAKGGPVFDFQLSPLKVEKSCRFSRKFGGDRLLVITLPPLQERDLPEYLKKKKPAKAVRGDILDWLVNTGHHILGRTWRTFFVKPLGLSKSQKMHRSEVVPGAHRIFLFATDGPDWVSEPRCYSDRPYQKMSLQELLSWFMPAQCNRDQLALKFFARLSLGVSATIPTIAFSPRQIILSDDAFSDSPQPRMLNLKRNDDKKRGTKVKHDSKVMNDGCALISQDAARAIARHMDLLDVVPSVFQARIGGAKGLWMVDPLGQRWSKNPDSPDLWIEITDSQLKFHGHPIDGFQPEKDRVTFEVVAWSRPLTSSSLNFQMMPILIHGGVPPSVLEIMLEEDLRSEAAELETAMDNPLKLRLWVQEKHNPSGERLSKGTIEWQGAMPDAKKERVIWYVEHGFDPKTCGPLKELCESLIRDHCHRLKERMNISIGLSTYAFIIADPLAILEEDEVHFCFSNTFNDSKSGFSDVLLDGLDVLVARSPSHLPSDIQKVRAVYRRELARFKDVVVFPSKGRRALADKLSGGDYDGDQVWVCWDAKIVEPFRNSEVHEGPEPGYFGITKDKTMVKDIYRDPDYASNFVRKGLECNIAAPILGLCTTWFEAYCYLGNNSIDDPMAKDVAALLGLLVDSAKAGHTFTDQMWFDFRKKHKLPLRPAKPAYKEKRGAKPTNHIIDRLVFNVAERVVAEVLKSFELRFGEKAILRDEDLTAPWKIEYGLGERHLDAREILRYINVELDSIKKFWGDNVVQSRDDTDFGAPRRVPALPGQKKKMTYPALVQACRDQFLAIAPPTSLAHFSKTPSYILDRWISDPDGWNRLKASGAFYRFKGIRLTWNVCGMELGKIKLAATRNGGRGVVEDIHLALRVDKKFAAVLDIKDEESSGLRSQAGDEGEEDEYGPGNGEWGFDD